MASVQSVFESGLPDIDHGIELEPLSRGTWKLATFLPIPDTPVGTRVIVRCPRVGSRANGSRRPSWSASRTGSYWLPTGRGWGTTGGR